MKALFGFGLFLLLCAAPARADVGPPPRDDCALLAPGSPCWAEGKRAGACVIAGDGGPVVCAAPGTPTRALASARPTAAAPSAGPAPEARSGCSFGEPRDELAPLGVLLVLALLGRRRWPRGARAAPHSASSAKSSLPSVA